MKVKHKPNNNQLCDDCCNYPTEYEVIAGDNYCVMRLCHNCIIELETKILQSIRSRK
jgi:hypothetical protein